MNDGLTSRLTTQTTLQELAELGAAEVAEVTIGEVLEALQPAVEDAIGEVLGRRRPEPAEVQTRQLTLFDTGAGAPKGVI